MKKTLNKIALAFLLVLFAGLTASAQQNYLTQTYLSAAQDSPSTSGTTPPVTNASVNSATGITAPAFNSTATINTQNQWQIYVDRELETVVGVNGTTLQVLRGQGGTIATSHASGAMVLAGHPSWFYVSDPGSPSVQGLTQPANVPCVLANVVASPRVNIRTGGQWVCNPNSLTWQPGFGSPFLPLSGAMATVASVGGATNISFPVIKISGTNAISSFTFTGNGAIGVAGAATANSATSSFCIVPTGAYTTTATNNIGAATTAIVGNIQCWYWNGTDALWYVLP